MGFSLQPALVSLHRVNELFSQISEDADPKRVLSLTRIKGKIQFDDVIFSYNTEPVLHNISIKFNEGEKIALVGPTGSGKSTTVKLILGFYNPTKGDIYIDGNNIRLIKLSSLRDRISIISQNIFLFNDTIRNNILYSRYKSTEDELLYAANMSGVESFLDDLPEGLETVVGEKGIRLSGGQKQMISIARAILKKPDILILDEATSHLDGLREAFLQKVILEDFKDKTCIIISHRLSSISLAYRCFVYDSGRIVQEGHYTELIEREGKFRELFKTQLAGNI
jgi:subfamily B ATP-binding cassette protein MsbA